MRAKVQQRINLEEERTPLKDVLPLASPYVLMVDPSSACNFHCLFCPTGDAGLIRSSGRYQGFMKLDLFEKIIDDLESFEAPVKVLRLYKEGEPLVNPFLPRMIQYAKRSKKILRIDTTTNGALLKPELNRRLIASGIDQINISVNGVNTDRFRKLTGATIDFRKYVENIRDLYENKRDCTIYIKAIYENMNDNERDQFFDVFGDLCDRIYLEHLQPNWPDFHFDYINVEYTVGHYGQELRDHQVCPFIFYIMVVNADGTVSLCVQDWAHRLIVGDVRNDGLLDIWRGNEISAHRIAHLEYRRKDNPTCFVCPVVKHGVLDDIDEHAVAIRDRYMALRESKPPL